MIFDSEFFDTISWNGIRMIVRHDTTGVTFCFSIQEYDIARYLMIPYAELCQLRVEVDANHVFGDKLNELLKARDKIAAESIAWG